MLRDYQLSFDKFDSLIITALTLQSPEFVDITDINSCFLPLFIVRPAVKIECYKASVSFDCLRSCTDVPGIFL